MTVNEVMIWENAKHSIKPCLYNAKADMDLKRSAAEYGFDDLVIVPMIEVDETHVAKVTESLVWTWGVTEEDVFKAAEKNACGYTITDLSLLIDAPATPYKTVVVTTAPEVGFGAYGIIPKRKELEQMFPDGYIAIPSSIHEFIVVPREAGDYDVVRAMIQSINMSYVKPSEQLSDHPYYF